MSQLVGPLGLRKPYCNSLTEKPFNINEETNDGTENNDRTYNSHNAGASLTHTNIMEMSSAFLYIRSIIAHSSLSNRWRAMRACTLVWFFRRHLPRTANTNLKKLSPHDPLPMTREFRTDFYNRVDRCRL